MRLVMLRLMMLRLVILLRLVMLRLVILLRLMVPPHGGRVRPEFELSVWRVRHARGRRPPRAAVAQINASEQFVCAARAGDKCLRAIYLRCVLAGLGRIENAPTGRR